MNVCGPKLYNRLTVMPASRLRPSWALALAVAASLAAAASAPATLPARADSVKFAVIGDSGTGEPPQYDVARQLAAARRRFPFDLVLMAGDNIYGSHTPADLARKFSDPYRPLLDVGVVFRASLGNHDDPADRHFPPFNMNGQRYYTFTSGNVRFLALDSDYLDRVQLDWVERTLGAAREDWKICFFHHPLYSDGGRHGSQVNLRVVLEPLFVRYGVDLVFSGHDHVYERLVPRKGITYFVVGASGELRRGDLRPTAQTAAGYDRDRSFLLGEVAGDDFWFEAVSRTGTTIDAGTVRRRGAPAISGRETAPAPPR